MAADGSSGWTEERVELLARLWADGHSASQIAGQLGGGVSRNAVIGKVHRLGLAGRVKAGMPSPSRPAKPRPAAPATGVVVEFFRHVPTPAPVPAQAPTAGTDVTAAVEIPVSQRVHLLDLREGMCRWPLGDPAMPGFGFCGGRAAVGHPYCVAHCRVAYQPAAERRRLRI